MRMHTTSQRISWRVGLSIALAAAMVLALTVPATATRRHRTIVQRTDVLEQGGQGVLASNGARLARTRWSLEVRWRVPTPESGSYLYPTPDQIPPGAPPHPPIEPGHPEVFTLWLFVFNHPDRCTDPCDFDDIGDTPARGGIYQLDGIVADRHRIRMRGKVRRNQAPDAGAMLTRPKRAEVHVAMAAHGAARRGDELGRQLNGAVGTPATWWPAIFPAP